MSYLFLKPINSSKSYLFLFGKKKTRMYLILMLNLQVRPKLRYLLSITMILTRQWPIVLRQYLRYYIYNLFILWNKVSCPIIIRFPSWYHSVSSTNPWFNLTCYHPPSPVNPWDKSIPLGSGWGIV